jgi:hypothetical protein
VENRKLVGVRSDRDLLRHVSPFPGHRGERMQDVVVSPREEGRLRIWSLPSSWRAA